MDTHKTKYGIITLYKNDIYINNSFSRNQYWDEGTLLKIKEYIPPDKNILEIGGHCGTSSIVYASFLNENQKVYVYEPQKNMYKLLLKNIEQNNLINKIIPFNSGVFCFNGNGNMHDIDLDGGGGKIAERYNDNKNCNFGGITLGKKGENINLTTIDSMNLENIGFIHCDAQGSENFIFSKSLNLINSNKPNILYENNFEYDKILYNNVCNNYPEYYEESLFDIKKYCTENLNYKCIERFNGSIDNLMFI